MPTSLFSLIEAKQEAQRRLAGAESPLDGTNEAAFESIRRGADGRLKIQALGKRRWSKRNEETFFNVLRECGNVAASARAAGVSKEAVWKRRREWPGFARRMEETLDEAEVVLEFRVACLGTNWSEDADDSDGAGNAGAEAAAVPPSTEPGTGFDPDLALRFLKWRRDGKNGRNKRAAALPSVREVRERIVRKVTALKKHRLREERRRQDGES